MLLDADAETTAVGLAMMASPSRFPPARAIMSVELLSIYLKKKNKQLKKFENMHYGNHISDFRKDMSRLGRTSVIFVHKLEDQRVAVK